MRVLLVFLIALALRGTNFDFLAAERMGLALNKISLMHMCIC